MATSGNTNAEPTGVPVRKVIAGFVAGIASTALVYVLNTHLLRAETTITPEVAAAMTTLISAVVAYIVPPSGNESVVP